MTTPVRVTPRLRRCESVFPLPHTHFPLEFLTNFCGFIVEVKQKLALSLLRTGEEYGEVETCHSMPEGEGSSFCSVFT